MKNKILSNLSYVFCAGLGLLHFILLAIPYVASFYKFDYGDWGGGKGSSSAGISGYKVMSLWDGGFGGVMSSIFQIFILILSIALLAYGVCGLLKAFGVLKKFPDKVGKIETKKLGEYGLFAYAGLNALLLIFLIILCATNTHSESEMGISDSAGIRMSAGIFLTLIFSIGTVVALKLLQKKFPASEVIAPETRYVCSKCGKTVKKSVKFCPECGGKVVVEQQAETTDTEGQPVEPITDDNKPITDDNKK